MLRRIQENATFSGLALVCENDQDVELDAGSLRQDDDPSAARVALGDAWNATKEIFQRKRLAARFLRLLKQGSTSAALECLAGHHFLLVHNQFAGDGDTVWHLLAEYGDLDLLQALCNFCKIHSCLGKGSAGKSSKACDGDGIIRNMINRTNRLKQTPLMFAAYHGRDEVIKFLLDQGADPWAADRCGMRTAVHYAVIRSRPACVHSLLENLSEEDKVRNGVRYVDARSASGFTPLHFAVASNDMPTIRALLRHDACIDAYNVFDAGESWISCVTCSTPLHVAALSNRSDCASLLLSYYALNKDRLKLEDPRDWVDERGRRPYDVATSLKMDELADILLPGVEFKPKSYLLPGESQGLVAKLQVIAARCVQQNLRASINEAEEFMKLLGTYQQHGRIFARSAYDNPSPGHGSSGASGQRDPRAMQGSSLKDARPTQGGSLSGKNSDNGRHGHLGSNSVHSSSSQRQIGTQSVSLHEGASSGRNKNTQEKSRKQLAIKQWLSYERKAVAAGQRNPRQVPLKLRSAISQFKPKETDGSCRSMLSCLCGGDRFLPPQPGEDVCGLCEDNKPLLQSLPCGHQTCLLCAKSLCYLLDSLQMVLCPFCGSLIASFGLA